MNFIAVRRVHMQQQHPKQPMQKPMQKPLEQLYMIIRQAETSYKKAVRVVPHDQDEMNDFLRIVYRAYVCYTSICAECVTNEMKSRIEFMICIGNSIHSIINGSFIEVWGIIKSLPPQMRSLASLMYDRMHVVIASLCSPDKHVNDSLFVTDDVMKLWSFAEAFRLRQQHFQHFRNTLHHKRAGHCISSSVDLMLDVYLKLFWSAFVFKYRRNDVVLDTAISELNETECKIDSFVLYSLTIPVIQTFTSRVEQARLLHAKIKKHFEQTSTSSMAAFASSVP
jgi:hypothetical protein